MRDPTIILPVVSINYAHSSKPGPAIFGPAVRNPRQHQTNKWRSSKSMLEMAIIKKYFQSSKSIIIPTLNFPALTLTLIFIQSAHWPEKIHFASKFQKKNKFGTSAV
jgi:hypothetical protein